jgi:tetratricopeptide (TPR) repeat protein
MPTSIKFIAAITVASSLLTALTWTGVDFSQQRFGRVKPTEKYAAATDPALLREEDKRGNIPEDGAITEARASLKNDPDNLEKLSTFGRLLVEKSPLSKEYLLEAIDIYMRITELYPQNTEALLQIADLSFDERLFKNSAKYYEKYMQIKKDDLIVKARYASALTFTGQHEKSEKLLREILAVEPNNFQALAYLSITLSEKGDKQGAIEIGEKAQELAPNEEGKKRFTQFLATLEKAPYAEARTESPEVQSQSDWLKVLEGTIKSNPVAGSKFSKIELVGEKLKIYMNNFPMQQMPEFAKEKFIGSIIKNIDTSQVKSIDFIDAESGTVMVQKLV